MSTRLTENRGFAAVAITVIRYRSSPALTWRFFCQGCPPGPNPPSSSSNKEATSLAATRWPLWMGSNVPPITPSRRFRMVCQLTGACWPSLIVQARPAIITSATAASARPAMQSARLLAISPCRVGPPEVVIARRRANRVSPRRGNDETDVTGDVLGSETSDRQQLVDHCRQLLGGAAFVHGDDLLVAGYRRVAAAPQVLGLRIEPVRVPARGHHVRQHVGGRVAVVGAAVAEHQQGAAR